MTYDPKTLLGMSPAELEQRRGVLIGELRQYTILKDAPTELLQELAFITGALRRKTAGPPKEAKRTKRTTAPAASIEDLDSMMS